MTLKEAKRRLASALREQETAREEVRAANALVSESTRKLPPHYVDEHRRFAPGERERIDEQIRKAQKASDRLASATSDVVNARNLLQSLETQGRTRGIKTARLFRIRTSEGNTIQMPRGTTDRATRSYAKAAIAAGSKSATVETAIEGGGHVTTYRELVTYRAR